MPGRPKILIVASTESLLRELRTTLAPVGHVVSAVSSFAAAKRYLEGFPRPNLIISEIKLGAFNGLHLAVRALALGIPALVVGDRAFALDAEQLGATWIPHSDAGKRELPTAVDRLLRLGHPAQGPFAWPELGPEHAAVVAADPAFAARTLPLN